MISFASIFLFVSFFLQTSEMYSIRMPNALNFSFDSFYATLLVLATYVPGMNSVDLS